MSDPITNKDLIEQYLLGDLQPADKKAIEEKINADKAFRKEVEGYKTLIEASKESEILAFREMLGEVSKSEKTQARPPATPVVRPFFQRGYAKMAIAAAITFFAALAFLFLGNEKSNPDELYAAYYQPFPKYDVVRGQGDSAKTTPWVTQYGSGKYEQTLSQLNSLPPTPETRFFAAMCYLEMNQDDNAIASLKEIQSFEGKDYKEESNWYLALTYLKSKNLDEARNILMDIAGSKVPVYNQGKAKEILDKL